MPAQSSPQYCWPRSQSLHMQTCLRHLEHRKRRATDSIDLLRQAGQRWTTASSRGILQRHPLLWNAGRDTGNLPVLGVAPTSLRQYRFTPPYGQCHPREHSWPKRNTSPAHTKLTTVARHVVRPDGGRPPAAPGRATAWREARPLRACSVKGVYRKGMAQAGHSGMPVKPVKLIERKTQVAPKFRRFSKPVHTRSLGQSAAGQVVELDDISKGKFWPHTTQDGRNLSNERQQLYSASVSSGWALECSCAA